MKQVILTETQGNCEPEVFGFAGQTQVVIGRSRDCSFRLEDPTVSRRHCLIDACGEDAWVQDLGSRNGTYLNGERIGQRPAEGEEIPWFPQPACPLHDGDELRLGTHAFRIHFAADNLA
jgi:pSer/pThr/pTyr-binding forkhead associated (FHA) protein